LSKKRSYSLKITARQFTGAWFFLGTSITIIIYFLKISNTNVDYFNLILALLSGVGMGFYSGSQFGYLILSLERWDLTNWLKAITYGWIVAVSTLYTLLFTLLLVDFSRTELLVNIQKHQFFLIIINVVLLPLMAFFATLWGCLLEPLVLGCSGLGAVLLFILRKKIRDSVKFRDTASK